MSLRVKAIRHILPEECGGVLRPSISSRSLSWPDRRKSSLCFVWVCGLKGKTNKLHFVGIPHSHDAQHEAPCSGPLFKSECTWACQVIEETPAKKRHDVQKLSAQVG